MPRLGAHMSIAGGLPLAIARAKAHGCAALQIFSKSASQWRARELPAEEIRAFRDAARAAGISPIVAHASYLINVATPDPALRARSIAALGEEVDRAEALGLLGVVLHPGARLSTPADDALSLVAEALDQVLADRPQGRTLILIEHTAGQGSTMGSTFGEIAAMIDRSRCRERIGVCLDTCHLLAAGYDLCTAGGYEATFAEFDRLIGFDRLKVFHLNDSKKPCGSRVDRHEHIGRGCLGLEPFRRLLNDRRFAGLPMLIETEKSPSRANGAVVVDPLDEMNLAALRNLLVPQTPPPRTGTASRRRATHRAAGRP